MKRKLFLFVVIIAASILIGYNLLAQEAIKVPAKARTTKEVKTFVNKQGFTLPASLPDTTMVYQGAKGSLFVFRESKKTGKAYKYYLPKK
jgi:hypothetical protein